jgi:violaxanthin de-epoxidase
MVFNLLVLRLPLLLLLLLQVSITQGFSSIQILVHTSTSCTFASTAKCLCVSTASSRNSRTTLHVTTNEKQEKDPVPTRNISISKPWFEPKTPVVVQTKLASTVAAGVLFLSIWTSTVIGIIPLGSSGGVVAHAADTDIVSCLFKQCPVPLAKCILNPNCLLNVACINTCTGKPDEINCQIQCGNLFENDVVGQFNKCAISDMTCVPRKLDDGRYPVPPASAVVPNFQPQQFFQNDQWYITAGQNPLFDIFPCQVHFFSPSPTDRTTIFAQLNWRVQAPDGEFVTRNTVQQFRQDPNMPGHLINDNNEYLHYSDNWWILDYDYGTQKSQVPAFVFVYYRGSNDAWYVCL